MIKQEYNKLTEIIKTNSGIKLGPKDHQRITNIVSERVKKLGSPSWRDYNKFISSKSGKKELKQVVEEITISETYFFRDINQCNAFKNHIISHFNHKKLKKQKLKIWSAGCSSGEEAYTLAMIIIQNIPQYNSFDISITGTDINNTSIEKAKKGVFRDISFRGVGPEIITSFFKKKKNSYTISDQVKHLVNFQVVNLMLKDQEKYSFQLSGFDIIFCRNVLIYFNETIIRNIFNGFYHALALDGHIILGHSEANLAPRSFFKPIKAKGTYLYQKKYPPELQPEFKTLPASFAFDKNRSVVKKAEPEKNTFFNSKQKDVEQNTDEIIDSDSHDPNQLIYKEALAFYFAERYGDAKNIINKLLKDEKYAMEPLILAALIRINLGDFERAIAYLRKIQLKDEFMPEAHFIFGLIYENESFSEDAISSYQAALFLNSNFFLSYFRLAHIYKASGNISKAVRAFQNALNVAKEANEDKIYLLSGGFSKKSLTDICLQNL